MACEKYKECKKYFKGAQCLSPLYSEAVCTKYELEEKVKNTENVINKTNNNPYWENICKIAEKQRKKGIETYGQGLEDNTWDIEKRIQYLEEELIDALMYCEWIKDYLSSLK